MNRRQQRQAFEAEVLPHLDAAYRLAWMLTGDHDKAEDLVQEACLRAFAGFQGYQPGTNARAWLLTILRRIYLNDRRQARSRPALVSLGHWCAAAGQHEPVDALTPGPEEAAIRLLDRELVLQLLATLPEEFRTTVALVDLEGLRYAEAAAVLSCPVGTVMSRLHRARLQLARLLAQLPALDQPPGPRATRARAVRTPRHGRRAISR